MNIDGVKPIPGYPGFSITNTGVVYNSQGLVIPSKINNNGYETVSLSGQVRGYVMVHNLVLSTYIGPPPKNQHSYLANHFDSNKLNNTSGNLEWVTHEQNAAHRALFSNLNYRRLVVSINGIMSLMSLNEASQSLGIGIRDVWNKIKSNEIHYISRREPMSLNQSKPGQFKLGVELPKGFHAKKRIWIKDILTEEVIEYESTSAAAKAHSVPPTNINVMITHSGGIVRIFKKKYLVSLTDQFPLFDKATLEDDTRLYSQGRPFIAYNLNTKQLVVGSSATAFTRQFNLPRSKTLAIFKENKLVVYHNWVLLYDTKENRTRITDFINTKSGYRPVFPD